MLPRRLVRKTLREVDFSRVDLVIVLDDDAHQVLKTMPVKRLIRWRIPDPYIDDLDMYRDIAGSLRSHIIGLRKRLA